MDEAVQESGGRLRIPEYLSGDQMIVMPLSSVKAIEISLADVHLPGHALMNVRLVS